MSSKNGSSRAQPPIEKSCFERGVRMANLHNGWFPLPYIESGAAHAVDGPFFFVFLLITGQACLFGCVR